MSDGVDASVHRSFWIISIVALIWNALGGVNFFVQMNPDALADFPQPLQAIVLSRPAWATAAFGIAVFGGTLGCVLLLLRKRVAVYLFVASLLGEDSVLAMLEAQGFASRRIAR